ncbi:hypothetical protein CPB83DRAFT_736156, partial [Crepidotus variabilis]
MIGGSPDRQQTAKSLLTKMVNSLTAKMEIGSPMACLYLLGNPDHYTSHTFKTFYWRPFVREVQKPWASKENEDQPEKVLLNKNLGKFVGLSPIDDYIFRPLQYENVNLYNWICGSQKERRSKKDQEVFEDEDLEEESANSEQNDKQSFTSFINGHPQRETHHTQFIAANPDIVPNFIGGTLPRRDQGDYEYYCTTMLALFKPWRSGCDIRKDNELWDTAFNNHHFSEREKQLMNNFNLKYECNDARDDYATQAKSKSEEDGITMSWENNHDMEEINEDDAYNSIPLSEDQEDSDPFLSTHSNSDYFAKETEMRHMEVLIEKTGWLNENNNENFVSPKPIFKPQVVMNSSQWKALIQSQRKLALTQKVAHLKSIKPTEIECEGKVIVSDISYIDQNFQASSPVDQKLIDNVVVDFSLNAEQSRAFCIIANHATILHPKQLKMYLGGMGGTGKSQVIKALITYFDRRNEGHRILILAPTGTAAALLNGST